MKSPYFLIVLMAAGWALRLPAQRLSLDEAIAVARDRRPEMTAAVLNIDLSRRADNKIKAAWQPQVSASGDARLNTQLQQSVIPIGDFGIPGIPTDEVSTVAFGVPFQASVGLDVTQKITDPNKKADRARNRVGTLIEGNKLAQQWADIRYEVTEAYFGAVYQQERLTLARQAVERAQASVEYYRVRVREGASLQNDLDRQLLDLSNAELNLRKVQLDNASALRNLWYRMGRTDEPDDANTSLGDDLRSLMQRFEADTLAKDGPSVRTEIQAELLQIELSEANAQKSLARKKPTVSAYGNYSLLLLGDYLSPFNYVGVRASMPIYDGKAARLEAEDEQLRQQVTKARIAALTSGFEYQARTARIAMQQSKVDLEQSRRNIDFAKQIYETDRFRLKEGAIVPNDLKASEFSLQNAESNYLSAVYSFLVNQLKYRKAAGAW